MRVSVVQRLGNFFHSWSVPGRALLFLVFMLHLFFAVGGYASEWMYGHQGYDGSHRAFNARNYLRFGYLATGFAQTFNVEGSGIVGGRLDKPDAYWHHPPGPSIILGAVFYVFGESAAAAKLLAGAVSLISFLLLMIVLRKLMDDSRAAACLFFLTFMPLYSSYLSLMNYEPFVILGITGIIFIYEKYRENPGWWSAALMPLCVFYAVFTDFPVYAFLFMFWIMICVYELRLRPGRCLMVILFPASALFSLAVLVFAFATAMGTSGADPVSMMKDLFIDASTGTLGTTPLHVVRKWNYYVDAFTPVPLVLSAVWLADLIVRLLRRKTGRIDAYTVLLFLSAGIYWGLLPRRSFVHDYFVIYFSIPMAIASGSVLWRLTGFLAVRSLTAVAVLRSAVLVLFVLAAVPLIWSARTSTVFSYAEPVHMIESEHQYDFSVSLNVLAGIVNKNSKPGERVAVLMPSGRVRMDFRYYLDRPVSMFSQEIRSLSDEKNYGFILVDRERINTPFLSHLLEDYNFVIMNRYLVFDTRDRLESPAYLRKKYQEAGLLTHYLYSLAHPPFETEAVLSRTADLVLKLRGMDEAQELFKNSGRSAQDELSGAVLRYNMMHASGRKPETASIMQLLTHSSEAVFDDSIEYLGCRIKRNEGGRTVMQMLFRPLRVVDCNVYGRITAGAAHYNETLRKEIGKRNRDFHFTVPSTMWRKGFIYLAERELDLFPGSYSLDLSLHVKDMYELSNLRTGQRHFPASCRPLQRIDESALQNPEEGIQEANDSRESAFTDQIRFMSCYYEKKGPDAWTLLMTFHNTSMKERHLVLEIVPVAGGKAAAVEVRIPRLEGSGGPGNTFKVDAVVKSDPSQGRMRLRMYSPAKPTPLETDNGTETVHIGRGNFGNMLPVQWLYWYGKIY